MQSIINHVSPLVSQAGKETIITVTGEHFTDGGVPIAFLADEPIKIDSHTDTNITITIPPNVDFGVHRLTILNGSEQP